MVIYFTTKVIQRDRPPTK